MDKNPDSTTSSRSTIHQKTIVVDLDGTLINTDLLIENFFLFVRYFPLQVPLLLFQLLRGKAGFKRYLADAIMPEVSHLPYNHELIAWLKQQYKKGARIVLATASDDRIARNVADYLGIFTDVMGTRNINLSSHNKRDKLIELFGQQGYEYVGNSKDDLAIWKTASNIHVVNPELGVLTHAAKLGPISTLIVNKPLYLLSLLKALRIHQWAKNLLIFVPLLASHRILEWDLLLAGLLAFIAYGTCASSVYVLNDLLDLPDDRQHPTKCNRPLASGALPIQHALFITPAMLIFGFGISFWMLPIQFTGMLAIYYLLTLAYSLSFKRIVMLDVFTLAILYTVRVIAGAEAMFLYSTFWILTFCMFIFFSLALLKRYTELCRARVKGVVEKISGRGYFSADLEILASLGCASGYISVVVLALYINESATGNLYHSPEWMWLACPLLLFWLSRAWLLAHRGQMHDDPIIFALSDKISLCIGLAFLLVFGLASI